MDNFTLKSKCAIVSKSGGGKSILLKYILSSERSKFNKIYCISGSEQMNGFYKDIVDKDCIFFEFKEEWLKQLIKKLKDYKEKNTKPYNVLLILDDLGYNKDFQQSRAMQEISCAGRHYNLFFCCLIQYLYQIPPTVRNNMNFILCGQSNTKSVDLLIDEYLFGDIGKKEFIKMYSKAKQSFGFLVICCDSVKNDGDLNTIYGVIRAPASFI